MVNDNSRAPVTIKIACVNGVALNTENETLSGDELRQRACSELLRQAALAAGLLFESDSPSPDGVLSEAATHAIETLLEQTLSIQEPSDEACQRHYDAHKSLYSTGERVNMRHILFAVTPGVNVTALRGRAEEALLEVRCHDGSEAAAVFTRVARALSNCPSGAEGGDLGWLTRSECAPEFAKEIFGHAEVGVLPRLVHSRFGLHVVEVLERHPGTERAFESVREAATVTLRQKAFATALRQYLHLLTEKAVIEGVDMQTTETPLAQ